jgi:hypothetical protein
MHNRQKPLIILSAVVLLLLLAGSGIQRYVASLNGTVTLIYPAMADTRNIAITFNGRQVPLRAGSYSLRRGSYRIAAAKSGYTDFTANFVLKSGETVIINAQLALASDSTLHSAAQLSLPQAYNPQTLQLVKVTYFYNKTWAVATIQAPNTDPGIVVVSYDPAAKVWSTALGPGTLFTQSSVQPLPPDVKNYLLNNNLAGV